MTEPFEVRLPAQETAFSPSAVEIHAGHDASTETAMPACTVDLAKRDLMVTAMHLAIYYPTQELNAAAVAKRLRRRGVTSRQFDDFVATELDGDTQTFLDEAARHAAGISSYVTPMRKPRLKRPKPTVAYVTPAQAARRVEPTDTQAHNRRRVLRGVPLARLVGGSVVSSLYERCGTGASGSGVIEQTDQDQAAGELRELPDLRALNPVALAEQLIDTREFPDVTHPPQRAIAARSLDLILLGADRVAFLGVEHELAADEITLLNVLMLYRDTSLTSADTAHILTPSRINKANKTLRQKLNAAGDAVMQRRNLPDCKGIGINPAVRVVDARQPGDYLESPTPLVKEWYAEGI